MNIDHWLQKQKKNISANLNEQNVNMFTNWIDIKKY